MSQTAEKAQKKATAQRRRTRTAGPAGRTAKTSASTAGPTTSKAPPGADGGPSVPVLVPEIHVRHVHLPQVDVSHVPVPSVHVPDQVRRMVPDPANNRLLWYGGLAGLAAFGVIGWPVAGVVAAATYVAEHRAKVALHEREDGGKSAPSRAS